jgi:hypothetical protein
MWKIGPICGRDFSHSLTPDFGLTQTFIKWLMDLFPGGKTAGTWR